LNAENCLTRSRAFQRFILTFSFFKASEVYGIEGSGKKPVEFF
jgi:hypothetical protein